MKPVKLLIVTSLTYALIFSLILLATFLLFFYFLRGGISQGMDEALANRERRVTAFLNQNPKVLSAGTFTNENYSLIPLTNKGLNFTKYSDTLIFEKRDRENYVYRKLSSVVMVHNRRYRLEIITPLMEEEDIVDSIMKTLWPVFILMVIAFFFATHYLSKILWKPFYTTLRSLENFEIDLLATTRLQPVKIEEFNKLNIAVNTLTANVKNAFDSQKQFIENASHELLTPLAISNNKLEELISTPNLTQQQSAIVHTLVDANQRMARLNKTLLLLSKIENGQFPDVRDVKVASLVHDILSFFDDQQKAMDITVHNTINKNDVVRANSTLIELLLSNLIKNAFVHNYHGGDILLSFDNNTFAISNTSHGSQIPDKKLFTRFYKNTARTESWGLGLAIVKKICTLSDWEITYTKSGNRHVFSIGFK